MCRPRSWEHGVGRVPALTPAHDDFAAHQRKLIEDDEYFARCRMRFNQFDLRPGELWTIDPEGLYSLALDGDTLCCKCAVGKPCHRRHAAELLGAVGWDVHLDGVRLAAPTQPGLF